MMNLAVNYNQAEQSSDRNFKTIGEVSSELGIPPYVLRFWESKFHIIKPHKRKGGHRYYSVSDVCRIKEIKRLLYEEGFTIKGAKKFLRERKPMFFSEKAQPNLFEETNPVSTKKDHEHTPSAQIIRIKPDVTSLENKPKIDPNIINSFVKQLEDVKNLLNSNLL